MPEPRIWYVVVTESNELGIWKIFTRDGYEHISCFAQCPGGVIVHNYQQGRIDLLHHNGWDVEDFALALKEEGKQVLRVTCAVKEGNFSRAFIYCVSMVKSCLGIRDCHAYTPEGLFVWLKKQDYVEVL